MPRVAVTNSTRADCSRSGRAAWTRRIFWNAVTSCGSPLGHSASQRSVAAHLAHLLPLWRSRLCATAGSAATSCPTIEARSSATHEGAPPAPPALEAST